MSIVGFVGPRSAMLELKYQGGLSTKTDRPTSFTRTLGGKQKAFLGARGRREWDVSFDPVSATEISGLVEIARTAGAVMWYPADAVGGNMLSPQAASFEGAAGGGTAGGLVTLPDGSVAQSVVHTGTGSVTPGTAHGTFEAVPVLPGTSVSVGGWGLNGIRFSGFWRDAALNSITNWTATAHTFTGWQWASDTLTVPAGASYLSLSLTAGNQYARPTVSWGAKALDRPGRGCPSAVVSDLTEDLTGFDKGGAYGSINVTITEVG